MRRLLHLLILILSIHSFAQSVEDTVVTMTDSRPIEPPAKTTKPEIASAPIDTKIAITPSLLQNSNMYFFRERKKSAGIGLGLFLAGLTLDYAVSVPLALDGKEYAQYIGLGAGALELSGSIVASASAKRASKSYTATVIKPYRLAFFISGIGTNLVGQLLYYAKPDSPASLILFCTSDALFLTNNIYAYSKTVSIYKRAVRSDARKASLSIQPTLIPKGGGVNFALNF